MHFLHSIASRLASLLLLSSASVASLVGCTLLLDYGDVATLSEDAGDGDAAPPDGSATEASAEASVDTPFCSSRSPQPTFCSSFDGPSLLSDWPDSHATNVRLERDTTSVVSPPASLRVAFDRTGSGGVAGAAGATFEAWANRRFTVVIDFDLQIEDAAPAGALAVIATPLFFGLEWGASYLLQIVCRPHVDGSTVGVTLTEVTNNPGAALDHPSSTTLQRGSWSHVQLSLDLGGPTNAARLSIDGRVGFEGPLSLPFDGAGTPNTSFGLATVAAETTAWSYRFDNVTLDFKPR